MNTNLTVTQLIEKYLDDKKLAWAETTLKSERHRLNAAAPAIDGKAQTLWDALQEHGAYGRQTIWTRVTDFYQWCLDNEHVQGGNPYRAFRQKNARQFKNVYTKKVPNISFEEIRARIQTIEDEEVRALAERILSGGLRYAESQQVEADGTVVGKGSKRRRVYVSVESDRVHNPINYQRLRRALATLSLRPHDLRKAFLNRLVELGANEFELCEVAGWSSISTASSYIKANDERIKRLVQMVQSGTAIQGVNQNEPTTEKQVS